MSQDAFKDSTGAITQVELDADNNVPVAVGSFSYRNILTLNTFVLKTTSGVLHTITLNTPVATGVIKIYDNNEAGGPIIASITVPTSPMPVTLTYDIALTGGLTIVTSVVAQDITISYK